MRFIIYGAGAVGGTIGARLFQHGYDVILICRGAHLDAIRSKGLNFLTPNEEQLLNISTASHPREIDFRPGDVVFLTMKTQDSLEALLALRDIAGNRVPIICAQNGVYNEPLASRFFTNVYGMLVMLPASFLEPGIVMSESRSASGVLDAGRFPSGIDPIIEEVTTALDSANFSARPSSDIMPWKYAKMLINLRNSLKVIADNLDTYSSISSDVIREAKACFTAAGIHCTSREEYLARRSDLIELAPIKGQQRAGDSTEQSILRGASSIETDYLNGEIVKLGCLYGIATPNNRLAQQLANTVKEDKLAMHSVSAAEFIAQLD
jgi:2-dehydropantoate 2-reductase